jgi:hypothetical protein
LLITWFITWEENYAIILPKILDYFSGIGLGESGTWVQDSVQLLAAGAASLIEKETLVI